MGYSDSHEHLRDELDRIDLLLRSRLSEWWDEGGGAAAGQYLSGADIDAFLRPSGEAGEGTGGPGSGDGSGTAGDLQERLAARAEAIAAEKREARREGVTLRLADLASEFGLSRRHLDVLLLGLAPRFDRRYGQVYAYLHDDAAMTRPTVDLALRLLCADADERFAAMELFTPSSPLVAHGLLDVEGEAVDPEDVLAVDRRVVSYLRGEDDLDPELAGVARVVDPDGSLAELPVDESVRETADAVGPPGDGASTYYFHGPEGAGTGRAVEALCDRAGLGLVRASFESLAGDPATLDRLVREATLRDAAVHLTDFDADVSGPVRRGADGEPVGEDRDRGEELRSTVLRRLNRRVPQVFLTGADPWIPEGDLAGRDFDVVAFPRPDYGLRVDLWEDRADELPEDVEPAELAAKFEMTQGEVDDAIATARTLEHDEGLTRESLYEGCKAQSSERLGELAEKIDPGYTWSDIVLDADTERSLKEVAIRIEYRGTVYSDWGFSERFTRGKGVVALFTGPSGTGKTMAAEVLANYAGLDLYKVDLSSVVSKYIGETEENLEEIFDEAEHSNAILLFDEADAIFGERSDVSDSTDRYANVEVNYLLQRIERYDGVVLMTSNLDQNIDDAFQRRIHITIDFPRPTELARQRIWQGMFPEDTPLEGIDFGFLASFDLTGGEIRNVAQSAAYRAVAEDSPVRMRHVVPALRQEFEKSGQLVDMNRFGEYRKHLQE